LPPDTFTAVVVAVIVAVVLSRPLAVLISNHHLRSSIAGKRGAVIAVPLISLCFPLKNPDFPVARAAALRTVRTPRVKASAVEKKIRIKPWASTTIIYFKMGTTCHFSFIIHSPYVELPLERVIFAMLILAIAGFTSRKKPCMPV